jgi:hypothetical protein
MNRKVDYAWRLAEIMAAHGMHNSTDLIPRLAERGIQLSRPQVYRIVHQRQNDCRCSYWQHCATS